MFSVPLTLYFSHPFFLCMLQFLYHAAKLCHQAANSCQLIAEEDLRGHGIDRGLNMLRGDIILHEQQDSNPKE